MSEEAPHWQSRINELILLADRDDEWRVDQHVFDSVVQFLGTFHTELGENVTVSPNGDGGIAVEWGTPTDWHSLDFEDDGAVFWVALDREYDGFRESWGCVDELYDDVRWWGTGE